LEAFTAGIFISQPVPPVNPLRILTGGILLMSALEYERLVFRGHFRCEVGIDYSGSFLGIDYGGGLEESEKVFPGLLTAKLSYPWLDRDVMVQPWSGEPVSRLEYIWGFYRRHMDNARRPFVMRSPLDKKLYLWKFADDSLSIELVDLYLGTTGLSLRQAYVRHMNTLEGGALDEGVENPSTI
jgi:hypothetical protein